LTLGPFPIPASAADETLTEVALTSEAASTKDTDVARARSFVFLCIVFLS
jgi:hypothetical protein